MPGKGGNAKSAGGRGKQGGGRGGAGRGAAKGGAKGGAPVNDARAEGGKGGAKKEAAADQPAAAAVAPGTAAIQSVTAGKGEVIVAFYAPKKDGGAPITKFTVTCSDGQTSECEASPCVFPGLAAGVEFTFTVTATNAEKLTSAASNKSNGVTLLPATIFSLLAGPTEADQQEAANGIAKLVKAKGLADKEVELVLTHLHKATENDKDKVARVGYTLALVALLDVPAAEAYVLAHAPSIFAALGDKQKTAKKAAEPAVKKIQEMLKATPNLARGFLPIATSMVGAYAWQAGLEATRTIALLAEIAPTATALHLEFIIPVFAGAVASTRKEVNDAVKDAMAAVCKTITNRDVVPFVPALISAVVHPTEVPEAINALAGTTFVQTVTAPVLAIMVPILSRGLREGSTACKRQTCVIIDNFAKLVDDPTDVDVFMPKLLPGVERAAQEISEPEARGIAERAHTTLVRVAKNAAEAGPRRHIDNVKDLTAALAVAVSVDAQGLNTYSKAALDHAALVAADLAAHAAITVTEALAEQDEEAAKLAFIPANWDKVLAARLEVIPKAKDTAKAGSMLAVELEKVQAELAKVVDDDEDGEDVCNCSFSLAYGSKILLNAARLRLKRGRRYGLVGPNGCGKSTLLRAIVAGQLDGFPPADELRTVYVECDISPDLAELNVSEFVIADPALTGKVTDESVSETLSSVGFDLTMQTAPVSSLSGGWRMKLALARAMLKNADILLLDEPTNHLDVANVTWVVDYICGLKEVTSIIVTHDAGFIERSCSDIIHFNYLKLKNYRCTLSEFVEQVPEAKAYYELKSDTLNFKFPEPGFLEGVKSKGRAILKMAGCSFTYPNTTKQILYDIKIQVSMASRCAVVGPNGAGKSTMIKLLTGELVPDGGTVWKHPNLVLAYVAQHAFHHIEDHLESTANEYIRWRFRGGDDHEGINKLANVVTEEEEKQRNAKIVVEGITVIAQRLVSRRKGRRGDEYEVKLRDKPDSENLWWTREKCKNNGWEKACRKIDSKILAEQGSSLARVLSESEVEKHLGDLGLDPEFATHTRIDSLSTSQKVKVVLAAATWNNPQVIVLDEPTNFLDRESLGALAQAIRDFNGGVVMISHNSEFTGALCPETWVMSGGRLHAEGASIAEDDTVQTEAKTEGVDARGNKVSVKIKKVMTRKEKKAYEKRRKARIAAGQSVSDSEDDE